MTVIRNDVDTVPIVGVAFAGAFFVAAFILFVQAWFYSVQQQDDASKASKPVSLERYEAIQAKKLNTYGWVDKTTNKVRIPIQDAKKAVVSQLNR